MSEFWAVLSGKRTMTCMLHQVYILQVNCCDDQCHSQTNLCSPMARKQMYLLSAEKMQEKNRCVEGRVLMTKTGVNVKMYLKRTRTQKIPILLTNDIKITLKERCWKSDVSSSLVTIQFKSLCILPSQQKHCHYSCYIITFY